MVDWQAEFGKSFSKAGKVFRKAGRGLGDLHDQHRRQHFGGRRPFGEAERGSVKYDILSILWDGPRHGYDIMLTIEEQRGYRPSPGSVYPALQMLEDADCITGSEVDGKRVYTITDKGSELLAKHREAAPEGGFDPRDGSVHLVARFMQTMSGVKSVLKEIARTRDPEMYAKALAVVERARGELYALLSHE